eukprot:358810-Chlamydomonas_euryale.AAC.6
MQATPAWLHEMPASCLLLAIMPSLPPPPFLPSPAHLSYVSSASADLVETSAPNVLVIAVSSAPGVPDGCEARMSVLRKLPQVAPTPQGGHNRQASNASVSSRGDGVSGGAVRCTAVVPSARRTIARACASAEAPRVRPTAKRKGRTEEGKAEERREEAAGTRGAVAHSVRERAR